MTKIVNAVGLSGELSRGRWRRFGTWLVLLWRRLLAALRRPTPSPPLLPPPPAPGRLTERWNTPQPIAVPARGYVFDFHVGAAFIWSSDGLPRETLNGSARFFMPYATRTLTRLAAEHARDFAPHRARELEVELQRTLAGMSPWRYERHGAVVTCRPHVWVRLDDRVKAAVQPYWEQLIKLDCEHDVHVKRARYAEHLSRQWLAVLEQLLDNPLAAGAARMTEKELAEVVQGIMTEQKTAQAKLDELLADRIRNGDAFERAESFETLLQRLRAEMGDDATMAGRTKTAAAFPLSDAFYGESRNAHN